MSCALLNYHSSVFLVNVRLLAEQQKHGIKIDQDLLKSCHADLLRRIELALQAFLTHSEVAHHISSFNQEVQAAWSAAEPPKLNKAGEVARRWEQWQARDPKITQVGYFNANSKPQLAWLFFAKMGYKATKKTPKGKPVVDRKVLPSLGEPGKLLIAYNVLLKRRGYVEAVIDKSARDGILHPQFNSVGAVTGRLGGSGGLNLQQMPKNKEFLECFVARPGHVLVQFDFTAIEPTLLAEFSQDATLLKIYGANAVPNDIYLYIASRIPTLGADILKYYDPENPTPEGIAAAKKHCKKARSISKVVQLASSYGAGADRIHETLIQSGIQITFGEVAKIHRDYWKLFAGVKRFEEQLKDMWSDNEGYIINVLGRPICVDRGWIKDIVNRMIQSSAHDCLQLFVAHLDRLRVERRLPWRPWCIDLHDETIVEVPENYAEATKQSFVDALAETNAELGMEIKLKGEPQIAHNLAEIKTE